MEEIPGDYVDDVTSGNSPCPVIPFDCFTPASLSCYHTLRCANEVVQGNKKVRYEETRNYVWCNPPPEALPIMLLIRIVFMAIEVPLPWFAINNTAYRSLRYADIFHVEMCRSWPMRLPTHAKLYSNAYGFRDVGPTAQQWR